MLYFAVIWLVMAILHTTVNQNQYMLCWTMLRCACLQDQP
jgi:hypothetical protein